MKTHNHSIKIFFLVLCASILVSCTDEFLNTIPKDRLSKNTFWKTQDDAIYALTGVYSLLTDQWRYSSMDAYTDIAHYVLQWREESVVEKNTLNSNNNVISNEWARYYQLIGTANSFLENIDLVEEIDENLRERLKAEAKTLRAFGYVNLIMLYGDVPLIKNTIDVNQAKQVKRTPSNEIWDFISEELTSAANNLPSQTDEQGRVTQGFALGLKARAMLYAGRYKEAKSAAKSVIDLKLYKLNDSYSKLFDYDGENSNEIIFARQFAKDLMPHSIFAFFTPNSLYTQQCQVVPTKSLVDAYLMQTTGLSIDNPNSGFDRANPYKNRDPRLYYTVYITGDILPNGQILNTLPGNGTGDDITISAENVTPTGWYFKKYVSTRDYQNPWNCGINLILMRYAEILLIYAESSIELGEIDQSVLDAINQIRERPDVNMPTVSTMNQSELREVVRRERKVELAMEGLRLYDIRRWRIAESVIPGSVKGMTYQDPKNPETFITVELTGYIKEFDVKKNYLWPIPFNEIKLNENLTQNPGY